MPDKLASSLIKTNSDYEKLKSGLPDDTTPRETPDHQSAGYRGLSKPELEAWTAEELYDYAQTLNLADGLAPDDREGLMDAIEQSSIDATRDRQA